MFYGNRRMRYFLLAVSLAAVTWAYWRLFDLLYWLGAIRWLERNLTFIVADIGVLLLYCIVLFPCAFGVRKLLKKFLKCECCCA